MRRIHWVAQIVLLVRLAWTQSNETGYAFPGAIDLCNSTFARANATGFFSVNPNVYQGDQSGQPDNVSSMTLPLDIALTITQHDDGSQLEQAYWINPRGANYSNNFQLGYDVCAVAFGFLTSEANYRGQSDNGSCSATLDQQCITAIKRQAAQYALDLTAYPTPLPDSNLTVNSIGGVCATIRDTLQDNFPQVCAKYINGTAVVYQSTAFTGYNSSVVYAGCKTNASNNDSYYRITRFGIPYTDEDYAYLSQFVAPILGIWMPIANAERPSSITGAQAELICSHVTEFNPGSKVPQPLEEPASLRGDGGLSKGAIAGTVVGAVAAIAIIAALVWILVRKRKSRKVISKLVANVNEKRDPQVTSVEAPAENSLSELSPVDRKYELSDGHETQVFELPVKTHELHGSTVDGTVR